MKKESKPLTVTHPKLSEEWDYEKNESTPDKVTYGSSKKAWWKCEKGHSFCQSPNQRTNKKGKRLENGTYNPCPHCAHTVATPGEYSFATEHPELMKEWDWEENEKEGWDPENILPSSNKKIHWVCRNNPEHKWTATACNRVSGGRKRQGSGCPYCDGKAFKEGITDLKTLYPDIASEWDYERNENTPNHVHAGSTKNAYWICPKGHHYEMPPIRRTNLGCGCSICAGKQVIYETSLACLYPDIANEWDYDKNDISPEEIAPKSSKRVWWICPENPKHSYEATVAARTYSGNGCPFCSGHQVLEEESFGFLYPDLLEEWDYEKNEGTDPFDLTPKSSQKVWWRCSRGHSWQTAVYVRTDGHGCNECKKGHTTSFAEQLFFIACQQAFPGHDVRNRYIAPFGVEIDVYIPHLSLGLEPGNWVLHKRKYEKDQAKREVCRTNGIRLITIYDEYKEKQAPFNEDCYTEEKFFGNANNYLLIRDILKELFASIDSISLDFWSDECWKSMADRARTVSNKAVVDSTRSLASVAPEIAVEWHPTLNGDLTPENVYAKGKQIAYWVCPKGHEYQAPVYDRVEEGRGCGVCSKRVADSRYNTISKLYPEFVGMFDESNTISPEEITPFNGMVQIAWKCPYCGEVFHKKPSLMFRAASTRCPHCGERLPHTPLNEIDF